MNATVYNPFARVWTFTVQYAAIISDELTNDNAQEFYAQGWETHSEAVEVLKADVLEGWENHAQACIAILVPSYQFAIAAYYLWANRNAPRLAPATAPIMPIAYLPVVEDQALVIDTSWVDWKAYLTILLGLGRFA